MYVSDETIKEAQFEELQARTRMWTKITDLVEIGVRVLLEELQNSRTKRER